MRIIYFTFLIFISTSLLSQSDVKNDRLDEEIDRVTYKWDLEADKLASYEGLQNLCADESYRLEVFDLLKEIHHYDTILYQVLVKLSHQSKDREIQRTLKEIKRFEEEYDIEAFVHYMHLECNAMLEIERESDNTRNEVGFISYSSQIYLLETELIKYVKHITKRVDRLRLHVHHLSRHYPH